MLPDFPIGRTGKIRQQPISKAAWFSLAKICRQPFLLVSGIGFCHGQSRKIHGLAWQRFAASLSYLVLSKRFGNSQSQKLHGSAWLRFAASLSYWPQGKDSATANLKLESKAAWFSLAEICRQTFLLVSDSQFMFATNISKSSQVRLFHSNLNCWIISSRSRYPKKRVVIRSVEDLPQSTGSNFLQKSMTFRLNSKLNLNLQNVGDFFKKN